MSAAPIAFAFQVQGDAEAKQKIQSVGGAFQNFGKTAESVNTQTEKMPTNFKQAALGLSSAAAATASLWFQFDNLQKSALRVEQAEKNLTTAKAALTEKELTLNKLVQQGKQGTGEYAAASLRLTAAQDQLGIAQQKVNLAQGDQTQAMTNLALTTVPTMIGAVSSASMAVKGLGFSLTIYKNDKALDAGYPVSLPADLCDLHVVFFSSLYRLGTTKVAIATASITSSI